MPPRVCACGYLWVSEGVGTGEGCMGACEGEWKKERLYSWPINKIRVSVF